MIFICISPELKETLPNYSPTKPPQAKVSPTKPPPEGRLFYTTKVLNIYFAAKIYYIYFQDVNTISLDFLLRKIFRTLSPVGTP